MGCYTSVISEDLLINMATKGRPTKYVNEHYFDIGSKRNSYILGALNSCYIPDLRHDNRLIIRSKSRELVELIKNELESEHVVISDTRGKRSYWLQITNKNLRCVLEEKGLGNSKKERRFPNNIKEEYIDHFIRGFFDERADIVNRRDLTYVSMGSFSENKQFLLELNLTLKKHAGVNKNDFCRQLTYGSANSLKIYNLIYRDWEYIRENGLYLPSQKDKFDNIHNTHPSKKSMLIMERIEKAKEHLLNGEWVKDFLKDVGYNSLVGLTHIFKKYTGQTVRKFREHHVAELEIKIVERVKGLFLQGKETKEILDEIGWTNYHLYRAFNRVTGQNLRTFESEIKKNIAG